MSDILDLDIKGVSDALAKKTLSSKEVFEASVKRVEEVDGDVQAFLYVDREGAALAAEEADKRLQSGEASRLCGVPLAVKDMFCTEGLPTTAGSQILKDFRPPYSATAVNRLKHEGGVILGKLNQDEFAMGSTGENSSYFATKNPWDLSRVPGGSSSGSAASVASRQVFYALGTDTGGSVRLPASFCGIVGWKPTYGRVSRSGVIAMSSSLDTIGAFARSVYDISVVAEALSGKDVLDGTTLDADVPSFSKELEQVQDLTGVRVGLPKEYFGEGIDPEVEKAVRDAVGEMEKMGAEVKEISLPRTAYAIAAYYIICPCEVSANMARYDGIRFGPEVSSEDLFSHYVNARSEGFGHEVKRRIMVGTHALSSGYYDAYYLKAQKARTLVKEDFDRAFEEVDVIASPVCSTVAWGLGEKVSDPLELYKMDVLTVPASLAGICGLSVPCGFASGMPVGMQLLGPQLGESMIFKVGHAYQQATDFHLKTPNLS